MHFLLLPAELYKSKLNKRHLKFKHWNNMQTKILNHTLEIKTTATNI